MKHFLREELHCPVPLTNMNAATNCWPVQGVRDQFDFVDDHYYWDHPNFIEKPWSLPSRGWSGGGSAVAHGDSVVNSLALSRLLDKPFVCTEFNHALPNSFRAESGPLSGGYAALQGWDALWRFAYSHGDRDLATPQHSDYFNVCNDPVLQASDRFGLLLFLRDAATAKTTLAATADPQAVGPRGSLATTLPTGLDPLCYVARVGTLLGAAPADDAAVSGRPSADAGLAALKAGGLPADNGSDPGKRVYVSETRQFKLDCAAGILAFDTPRCRGIFTADGRGAEVTGLRIGRSNAAVGVYVASLSDQPIETAPRLLLTHLPDVQDTGRRYAESGLKTLLEWGRLPHLVRDVTTEITLALNQPERCQVFALGLDGARLGPVATTVRDGRLVLPARTRNGERGVIYYEITR
jgi:hypothetical protein